MNIVFDIGNVLLRWDPRFLYRKLFSEESQMEWFLAHVCTAHWNEQQDAGRSFGQAVQLLTQQFPEHAELIAAYDSRWQEMLPHAIEGTVAVLQGLHAQGAPLYAITNWNGDKFRETRQRFEFLNLFRDIVVSGDEGLIKPDAAIYRLLLQRNHLAPEQCLFIDDSARNVAAAQALGMQAHHFTSPENLRQALGRMALD